ncbi:XdhC/CoxI family protein [uncultured Dokdonia sp.]|uniref:XdhC family protein n=1 Tax=uncultured Dokdonia sp. TaxID=575653 RepID=UPI002610C842|nr:XdhC/CoxI family protein [uncultured Dokdonia sp.]
MTHEFKTLINTALHWQQKGIKIVLATVVALEGSSYRKPGVRMLISDRGEWQGAVSGGCVEKEVARQAQSIFKSQQPKIMSYDGRFRLGCEGIIYILLEPFYVDSAFAKAFSTTLQTRETFHCQSYYSFDALEQSKSFQMGTIIEMKDQKFPMFPNAQIDTSLESFLQTFSPIFQLYIFGAEHDAVELSKMTSNVGWDVHIIAPPDEQKSIDYFTGASSLSTPTFDNLDTSRIDENTAVVLMTHSFNKDVQYLIALRETNPAYFGLLGPTHRRERLFAEFLERFPDTEPEFIEKVHGPAGINIGAQSASEIAISIIAEILTVIRNQKPISLREKAGTIHG